MADATPRWRSLTESELERFYWDTIAPDLRRDGYTPDKELPSYTWLVEHGYRGFEDAVRQHGYSLTEFGEDVLGIPSQEYDWGITHTESRKEIIAYLNAIRERKDRAESTLRAKRSRLSRYGEAYSEANNTDDILAPAQSDTPNERSYRHVVDAFMELDRELAGSTCLKIYSEVNDFYDYLVRWYKVDQNPVKTVPEEFDWSKTQSETKGLTEPGIRDLIRETQTEKEYLVLVALAGWGLRPSEVAALNIDQFRGLFNDEKIDAEYPYLEFTDKRSRKNSLGTVTLLYGVEEVRMWIAGLETTDEWNGELFPSSRSESGHVTTRTLREWFTSLTNRANVTVEEKPATPKHARRFWYSVFRRTIDEELQQSEIVAEEQGSESADVLWENYFDEQTKRQIGRRAMEGRLEDIFSERPGYKD